MSTQAYAVAVPSVSLDNATSVASAGIAHQGDQLTIGSEYVYVSMTSGAVSGRSGTVLRSAIAPVPPAVALGIYAIDTVAHGWRDSWAGEQKTLTGVAPKVIHVFKPWSQTAPEGGPWGAFDPAWADDAIACGSVPLITWEGRDLSQAGTAPQFKYSNAGVLSGQWDSTLTAWLDAVHAWGKRLILRLDHEGNGQWYPWAAGCNGNTAESAIAAFRYKARLIRAHAPNIQILWCPGTSGSGWLPFEDVYPGSSYVDWLGCDFYNTSDLPGNWSGSWTEFSGIKPYYDRLCALDASKPIIVAETGCVAEAGHDKAAWLANIPAACATMPRIAAVVEFDQTYGALDFRISADPTIYSTWKSLAANPRMQGAL